MSSKLKTKAKKAKSKREQSVIKCSEQLKKYSSKQTLKINFETFGKDKNKKKKGGEFTNRGGNSAAARQCSKHLRIIFPQNILQDNEQTEFCVNSRNNADQECDLCLINKTTLNWKCSESLNMAEMISNALGVSNDPYKRKERLKMAVYHYILDANYPDIKNKYSILRVKKNGKVIINYYIKLSPFSSMLKASSPSGYKYKDRNSVGRCIKIRANKDKDVIFCIDEDNTYDIDPEIDSERPFVNLVGFWNLLKDDKGIRNIIQLNEDRVLSASFKCLIDTTSTDIQTIDIELVSKKHGLGNKPDIISLWHYPNKQKPIDTTQDDKYVDGSSGNYGQPQSYNNSYHNNIDNFHYTQHQSYDSYHNNNNINYNEPQSFSNNMNNQYMQNNYINQVQPQSFPNNVNIINNSIPQNHTPINNGVVSHNNNTPYTNPLYPQFPNNNPLSSTSSMSNVQSVFSTNDLILNEEEAEEDFHLKNFSVSTYNPMNNMNTNLYNEPPSKKPRLNTYL